jgi:hypothetical protein
MITIVWLAGAAILFGLAELATEDAARGNIRGLGFGLIAAGIGLEIALAHQVGWLTR